jgi:hypothetical protein
MDDDDDAQEPAEEVAARPEWSYTTELLLSLELVALAAFAFSRPVLDTFGRSPETLVARGVTGGWVVAFGLIVAFVPAVVASAVGVATRRLGGRFRGEVHAGLVGVLGGIGVWRFGQDVTGWPGDATKLLLAGPLAGLAFLAVRHRVRSSGTFLRVGGAASVIYLVLFLTASPASDLVRPPPIAAAEEVEAVAAQLGGDAPDVVLLVFDELPLGSLLDGGGHTSEDPMTQLAAVLGDPDPIGMHLDARRPGDKPRLVFDHVMLPHIPWRLTGDGSAYTASRPAAGLGGIGWSSWGTTVGLQRHILQLQAADQLLGGYVDALRDAGTYDDALVIVTADHGACFDPRQPIRGLTDENYDQIMWTPLVVKAPGQSSGRIDDSDVRSVDILPTIADTLGIEVPWAVDGVPVEHASGRDGATKPYMSTRYDQARDDGGGLLQLDARAGFERVLAADAVEWTGPDAVWKRTEYGDLVGRRVAGLAVRQPVPGEVAVDGLEQYAGVGPRAWVPIEILGMTDLTPGTAVALAVNGTVGAVTRVEEVAAPARDGATGRVHAIVPPRLVVEGTNDVEAYVVEGPIGAEQLRPVEVVAD